MASKRSQITMTDDEVQAYLEPNGAQRRHDRADRASARRGDVVRDGRRQAVFWTFGKSQKIVNLRRDPKMTGLVESGDTYDELRGVELAARGVIVDDYDEVLEIGKAVGVKYNGPSALGDAALPFLEAQATKRLGVVFEIEHIVSWDHTKLGGAY